MPEVTGIDNAARNMLALHDETNIHHAAVTIRLIRGEMKSFLANCPDDPLLLAYDLRKPLHAWATHLLKLSYWVHDMIETGDPSVPPTGAK